MDKNFNELVEHGAAPFEHDAKNGPSYFAVLRDENGMDRTVWGVDIERSLLDAGVEIGDSISLVKGGKEPVVVQVKNAKGVMEDKTVDRFVWNTEIEPMEMSRDKEPEQAQEQDTNKPAPLVVEEKAKSTTVKNENDGLFSVIAPYWLDGLHNHKGIELAEKLNKMISAKGIAGNENAIREQLAIDEDARKFMLGVTTRQKYLDDQHLKSNRAEPAYLLDKMFARDKEGCYRPVAGGSAVLADKGDILSLKNRKPETLAAAFELAAAKGWTSIELTGSKKMMCDAWLEAQVRGIKISNYQPTEKDKERLAERRAEEKAIADAKALEAKAATDLEAESDAGFDMSQSPKYKVSFSEQGQMLERTFDTPGAAGESFASVPDQFQPMVTKIITVDGKVVSNIVASTNMLPGQEPIKSADAAKDQKFADAFAAVIAAERADIVKKGEFTGKILDIKNGIVYQQYSHDRVIKHELNSLTRKPEVGVMENVKYKGELGHVKDRALERGRESVAR